MGDPEPDIRSRALQNLQINAPPELVDSVERRLEQTRVADYPKPSAQWGEPEEKRK